MEAYHIPERMNWFMHDRFGMFIHWGLFSVASRGVLVQGIEEMTTEEYRRRYMDDFGAEDYNPAKWARMAKNAGMKYAVLTVKHHDGFCLYDTALTDYKATNAKAGRDLVREFVDAFRAEGLRVGLYFSVIDWSHPDYPHYGDWHHPMRHNEEWKNVQHDFERYLAFMHGQVRELCTNYGKLDILWFDFSYGEMAGEKWRATELIQMVRSLQPDVIIDNRLEEQLGNRTSLNTGHPLPYAGDFVSPEQLIPLNGIQNDLGQDLPWEACVTMNKHWDYCSKDKDFKPASMLIHKLVECVSKGGNLLLNVGPDPRGNIPEESEEILTQIGRWMHRNSASIYGCTKAGRTKPENGRLTRNGNRYYYHITENSIGGFPLLGFPPESIEKIRLLHDGTELTRITTWPERDFPDITFVSLSDSVHLPDPIDTVVEITVK